MPFPSRGDIRASDTVCQPARRGDRVEAATPETSRHLRVSHNADSDRRPSVRKGKGEEGEWEAVGDPRIVSSCLIFSTLVAECGGESADPISVRYRVTFLGDVKMPARIQYETPTGTREITVDQLPWQSAWMKFDPHAAVAVVVRIPMTDPTGNLQCEVLTDEPGTTVQSVPTRRCEASGNLPFARS
jgi:hypothetical protein